MNKTSEIWANISIGRAEEYYRNPTCSWYYVLALFSDSLHFLFKMTNIVGIFSHLGKDCHFLLADDQFYQLRFKHSVFDTIDPRDIAVHYNTILYPTQQVYKTSSVKLRSNFEHSQDTHTSPKRVIHGCFSWVTWKGWPRDIGSALYIVALYPFSNHFELLYIHSKRWQLHVMRYPNCKVHGANMGPIWGRQDPGGPHVGPLNFAIWVNI